MSAGSEVLRGELHLPSAPVSPWHPLHPQHNHSALVFPQYFSVLLVDKLESVAPWSHLTVCLRFLPHWSAIRNWKLPVWPQTKG